MTEDQEDWPTEEEIEVERLAAWRALSAEEKLEFLESLFCGLLAARAAGPVKPKEKKND